LALFDTELFDTELLVAALFDAELFVAEGFAAALLLGTCAVLEVLGAVPMAAREIGTAAGSVGTVPPVEEAGACCAQALNP